MEWSHDLTKWTLHGFWSSNSICMAWMKQPHRNTIDALLRVCLLSQFAYWHLFTSAFGHCCVCFVCAKCKHVSFVVIIICIFFFSLNYVAYFAEKTAISSWPFAIGWCCHRQNCSTSILCPILFAKTAENDNNNGKIGHKFNESICFGPFLVNIYILKMATIATGKRWCRLGRDKEEKKRRCFY